MKKIAANSIFPGNSAPIKNGVVVLGDNGTVLDVLDPKINTINWEEVKKYEGIICPGFVNAHCHLELSYLKGQLTENTKLHGFVKEIIAIRENYTEEERLEAIHLAEQEMIRNGIVAVGDISNGDSTFEQKEKSILKYHTFIEVFGSDPKIAINAFAHAEQLYDQYFDKKRASISPHAAYSVSDPLGKLINQHCITNNSLNSIHNQECESENTFFKYGKGELFDFLNIAEKTNHQFLPTGKNALPSFLGKFKNLNKTLLIHNTYTAKEDLTWAKNYSSLLYWCFCPNANVYIENNLPNFDLFSNEKCTIGTDSLASNWSLSILDELKTISSNNPSIPLTTLIKWSTYNGAEFLGFDELGSIEKGKTPGINLIENVDLNNLSLYPDSSIKKLV